MHIMGTSTYPHLRVPPTNNHSTPQISPRHQISHQIKRVKNLVAPISHKSYSECSTQSQPVVPPFFFESFLPKTLQHIYIDSEASDCRSWKKGKVVSKEQVSAKSHGFTPP